MEITKEYAERLKELAGELDKATDNLFRFEEGRISTSSQVSEAEIAYVSKVKYLIGYIDAL
jgi:hypothetical protein